MTQQTMESLVDQINDELLSPQEKEEEKKWESEFQKRRLHLEREKTKFEERKRRSYSRLESLSQRWRTLEQRRMQRSHLQRSATTVPSDTTAVPPLTERVNTVV